MKPPGSGRVEPMMPVFFRLLLCLALFTGGIEIHAQEAEVVPEESVPEAAFEVTTAIVPVVASVTGIGDVLWRTDVLLRNEEGFDREVYVELAAMPERFIFTTIPGSQSMFLSDLVAGTFGAFETVSPLIVKTLGPRSVAIATVIVPLVESMPGSSQVIPTINPLPASVQRLGSLELSEDRRANVGFVNLSEVPATFTAGLQRISGRNLAVNSVTVAPGQVVQLSLWQLFPLIDEGDDFSVVVEVPAGGWTYASVIENLDHTAVLVEPVRVK